MDDPTKLDSSGNENKTAIKANTTADTKAGDFVAGTVLADRYRIIGLVGKGGMGEVYKAEDIKLSQMVALKFLPDSYQNDSGALERFHAEVRNARQVSHVNVCRVFDIGEIDGRHFLSMEFVDGDDLSELLTRVGRFTHERAVEISRQLCVGMEAIHKAGILHRDFKPANIIIDKKGIARITDFGIAGIEADISKDEIRSGTPAYMSPEQITGKEVTTRSDIYALGLVIYEIFTGKQAFIAATVPELIKMHQTATPTNPSTHVNGIDPLVESVIAQCLEKDPKDRPQSALHVAMALPGGNPMQIALDAGQTPSPEMVAASPKIGALKPIVALALLLTIIVGYGVLVAASKSTSVQHFVPLDKSPDVLSQRSRELVKKFGYPTVDAYHFFGRDIDYYDYLKQNDQTQERWQKLATGQPAVLSFDSRTGAQPIVPLAGGAPNTNDPPNVVPGMTLMRVDTTGRLIYFEGVPPRVKEADQPRVEFDWAGVFKEAGFDLTYFQAVEPQLTPPQAFDEQRAFSGKYPDGPEIPIRVEAAVYQGKLVHFQIVAPWDRPPGAPTSVTLSILQLVVWISLYLGLLFGGGWLALRNIRAGRSDLKNAFRVGLLLFVARMMIGFFTTHHVASFGEFNLFITALAFALLWAVLGCLLYLAFEPYLRKIAPERVISWNRLLAGDWRDPLVGRDVLIGVAGTSFIAFMNLLLKNLIPRWQGKPPNLNLIDPLKLSNIFPAIFSDSISQALIVALGLSFFILFFGLILRRKWLGAVAVWLILIAVTLSPSFAPLEIVSVILANTLLVFIATRFGVVAVMALWFFNILDDIPFTTDISAWYSGNFILFVIVLLATSFYGFYTSTAGQKLWQGKLLGDGD
ncbi:MAG: protein kinase [Pyrinomonadaceae bacterium]|nr:protein kinase [Pyrinomonadaceae bacterium]MBP6213466.1 protein kinase [Pyrinomonadaceae bacterium]